jgi:hypothetical protein
MDTIAIIIVTAFVNIVISSIVSTLIFYRVQKKTELSFAKKLEEFRANLQYSNFEQQTKFARLHAKRMEVLETWFQKFREFEDALNAGISALRDDMENGTNTGFAEKEKLSSAKFTEFWKYYEANILFIPYSLDFYIVQNTDE